MEKGKRLIEEDAEQYESKVFSRNLKHCVNRLNDFIEKFEQTCTSNMHLGPPVA